MHILVTAGNTQAPIDRVRCLTNIFTGRTGAAIALEAFQRGHRVWLLTSRPEAMAEIGEPVESPDLVINTYRTFEELDAAMAAALSSSAIETLVHCAAVSDYLCTGVYAPAAGTSFDAITGHWHAESSSDPTLQDRRAGKVKSDAPELWLRLERAPKLIDRVRTTWGFRGVLVKFKLEVGVPDERLIEIAEASRKASQADLLAANTLDGAGSYALLGPLRGGYERVSRHELPRRLLDAIESLHRSPLQHYEAGDG